MKKRGSGILFHVTSLPSPYGIGDLGTWAYRFADFLSQTKQSIWQILPLNPTDLAHGNSPYNSMSAFANNTLLISPELMFQSGLLNKSDIEPAPVFPEDQVIYHEATMYKKQLFDKAYHRFKENRWNRYEYEKFCFDQSGWLDDFSLFTVIKNLFQGQVWNEWPFEIRDREPESLETLKKATPRYYRKRKIFAISFFSAVVCSEKLL